MRAEFLTPAIAILTFAAAGAFAADPPAAPAPAAAPAAAPAPAAPAPVTFAATMTGANEVDNSGKGGQGDAKGSGSFVAHIAKGQLCYTLSWSKGIDDPTMAHIHKGVAGSNGPVYIGFSDVDTSEHCMDVDKERLDAITAHPGDYYVNIHNGDFPGGALRGQLTKQ